MKKITIICSFLLIAVFSTGTFLIHLYYLKSYKKEFKHFLNQSKDRCIQSIIFITPSELYSNSEKITWEDENKEVVYKGVLYDVIEIKSLGKKVAIIAVSDHQEMLLKKQFAELYDVNDHQATKNPFHLLKKFLGLKTIITATCLCFEAYPSDHLLIQIQNFFRITSVFISEDTPPPDFLS